MPTRPCPNCNEIAPRWLDGPSQDARVNYYRCDSCGHVWNVPKTNPDAEPEVVMEGAEQF